MVGLEEGEKTVGGGCQGLLYAHVQCLKPVIHIGWRDRILRQQSTGMVFKARRLGRTT